MYAEEPDCNYDFLATVFLNRPEGGWRLITSRVIDIEGDIQAQLRMLISDRYIHRNQLACLQTRAMEILERSTQYGMPRYYHDVDQLTIKETEL